MDVGNLFKSLSLDSWYKALIYFGGIVFLASLIIDVKGIGNVNLQLLAGAAFLLGLGEWKNHKVVSWFKLPNAYTGGPALMSNTIRKADFVGILLEGLGILLIAIFIWKILRG